MRHRTAEEAIHHGDFLLRARGGGRRRAERALEQRREDAERVLLEEAAEGGITLAALGGQRAVGGDANRDRRALLVVAEPVVREGEEWQAALEPARGEPRKVRPHKGCEAAEGAAARAHEGEHLVVAAEDDLGDLDQVADHHAPAGGAADHHRGRRE